MASKEDLSTPPSNSVSSSGSDQHLAASEGATANSEAKTPQGSPRPGGSPRPSRNGANGPTSTLTYVDTPPYMVKEECSEQKIVYETFE